MMRAATMRCLGQQSTPIAPIRALRTTSRQRHTLLLPSICRLSKSSTTRMAYQSGGPIVRSLPAVMQPGSDARHKTLLWLSLNLAIYAPHWNLSCLAAGRRYTGTSTFPCLHERLKCRKIRIPKQRGGVFDPVRYTRKQEHSKWSPRLHWYRDNFVQRRRLCDPRMRAFMFDCGLL
jgi:hypothetical protein